MERRVIHERIQLPTLAEMRAAAEALKGVNQACDITRAKPEFVEFIRTCHPASVLAVLNQHAALVEQRDRLLAVLRDVHNAFETGVDARSRWAHKVRAVIREADASIPQPNEPQAKGGSRA